MDKAWGLRLTKRIVLTDLPPLEGILEKYVIDCDDV